MDDTVAIVKRWLMASAKHYAWNDGTAPKVINEQHERAQEVATLPKLNVQTYPIHPSVDEDQSGVIVAAHLNDEQMRAVPALIAAEVLDAIAPSSAMPDFGMEREVKRTALLAAYGPSLADLVCQAIDEGLESRHEGYKRLREHDESKIGPLDCTDFDEPYYERCKSNDEHATPTTEFDFYDAINAASELIEQRDRAAALARKGIAA